MRAQEALQARRNVKKMGGVSSTVHNLPHLVGIRLIDLPKLGVYSSIYSKYAQFTSGTYTAMIHHGDL